MPFETLSYKTASDVVKEEAKGRFSRDDDVLASGSGIVECGTVLGMVTASGKFAPLDPAASDGTQTAAAVILQQADATSEDQTVVNLKRRAQVVWQALVWPETITDEQRDAARASLASAGIIARNGV